VFEPFRAGSNDWQHSLKIGLEMITMKPQLRLAIVTAALALGTSGAILAADAATSESSTSSATSSAASGTTARHWHAGRRSPLVGTLLRASRQLNLTSEQKTDIKNLLVQARSAGRANAQLPDMTVLGNPSASGYAAAVQTLKTERTAQLERDSALASSIYQVLTPAQQQALPGVLADMKAKFAQRRASWQQRHAASSNSSGS
jgi:Spy/CpxP family protein refolding chaperone